MVTTVVVAILLGGSLMSALLWVLFLRLGLRWAKVEDVTAGRLAKATVFVVVIELAATILALSVTPSSTTLSLAIMIGQLLAAVLIPCLIIAKVFKTSFARAFRAWLPTIIAPVITILLVMFAIKPYFVEAFVIPTNSMAPTILGHHLQGTCQQCGGPAFCSATHLRYGLSEPTLMICRDNFHVTETADYGEEILGGDRVIVTKFTQPRRWDIIVFRYPENPDTMYIKRLVGMPGEQIVIKDGHVWANGKKLIPPVSIRGIEYLGEMPVMGGMPWGSPRRPARLAYDEYFVLGDFTQCAKDSRLWQQGAPGHAPFAVPKSHFHGVVTNIYWPPSRWRAFR